VARLRALTPQALSPATDLPQLTPTRNPREAVAGCRFGIPRFLVIVDRRSSHGCRSGWSRRGCSRARRSPSTRRRWKRMPRCAASCAATPGRTIRSSCRGSSRRDSCYPRRPPRAESPPRARRCPDPHRARPCGRGASSRLSSFHLRDLRVGIRRIRPVGVGGSLLAAAIQAGQCFARRGLDPRGGGQTIAAAEQVEAAQAAVAVPTALAELVGDKGYHSNETLVALDAVGLRPTSRGRRCWTTAPEAQAPVYSNRRRVRGRRGKRLMRRRGEYVGVIRIQAGEEPEFLGSPQGHRLPGGPVRPTYCRR
jgi:hypothetical protein